MATIERQNAWHKSLALAIVFMVVVPANYLWDLYCARTSSAISFWQKYDNSNDALINHHAWQAILDKYLVDEHSSGINRFAYDRVTNKDRLVLNQYIDRLVSIDPRQYSEQEQLAYWINLYNVLTIKLVIEHRPDKSIREVGSFPGLGPWDDEVVVIQRRALTLNQIEHGILRPRWKDSRIHFLINCASVGCPSLQKDAVTANNVEKLLEASARDFINHSRAVMFDDGGLILSKIFDWYQKDFANDEGGVIQYLAKYAEPDLLEKLSAFNGEIDYQYDWNLNSL